jgi:hypothetical protein
MPRWIAVSLIALVSAVALVLSYLALTSVGSDEHEGLPVRTEATASEENLSPPPAPPADAQPEPAVETPEGTAPQRMLAMVSNTAMRATSGTCANPGTVEISLDGAESWTPSESLVGMGATQILRVLPTDLSLVQVVALDQNCEAQVYRSVDLGASWQGPLSVAGTWYFDPSTPTQVGSPDGPRSVLCEGAELAAAGNRAAVRCVDGSVITTIDRGITWSETAGIADVLAINYSPDSYVMAQGADHICDGLRFATLNSGTASVPGGCFNAVRAAGVRNSGAIAIAQSGNSTLLWVGDDLVISTDGGRTWL